MYSRDQIVLGVVYNDSRDKVLVARRPRGSHLGGLLEFPGGKAGSGETARQALQRELYEEVNIAAGDCSPLISFDYDYPGRRLRFSVWKVHGWTGQVRGKEGQATKWVDVSSLDPADFPPANKGIITACKLPPVYLITPDLDEYPAAFMDELQEYVAAGIRLVQYRSKKSNYDKQAVIDMIDACRSKGAELIINSTPGFAMDVGAAGVHLTGERLLALAGRPLPTGAWVAASCHNMQELLHAVKIDADFCVLSRLREKGSAAAGGDRRRDPFFAGNSLGWGRFSAMADKVPVPVYALGGTRLSDIPGCGQYGAQGVALISDVWSGKDAAARITRALVHPYS